MVLIDKSKMIAFAYARVDRVIVGGLKEMAEQYAVDNHNQKEVPDGAPERLMENMKKRYGPHLINDTKKVTVIYLTII